MNWDQLYKNARDIAAEACWMSEKLREVENETTPVPPRFAEARTLINALDAAGSEVLVEVRNLWDALVVAPVAGPAPGTDALPAPSVSAQRILGLLREASRPIGELIDDLDASDEDGRLSMLLMAGMTGVFTAIDALAEQMEDILRRGES